MQGRGDRQGITDPYLACGAALATPVREQPIGPQRADAAPGRDTAEDAGSFVC